MPKKKRRHFRPRRAYRRFRRGKQPMPILPLIGLGVALSKPAELAIAGNFEAALAETGARFTGYNFESKQFNLMYAVYNGWLPVLAGIAGSKVMDMMGMNRYMRRVPMIGKYIKL